MKGQISFDFLLALIVALILLQELLVFSDTFLLNQEKITIRLQEQKIIDEIHQILTYKNILDYGEKLEITHNIPAIHLSGPAGGGTSGPINCDITIDSAEITITVNSSHYPKLGQETISESIDNTSAINFGTTGCNSSITISN